ncbi:MAG: 4Fe-4S binding protein [Dehalococcoidia bacterium]
MCELCERYGDGYKPWYHNPYCFCRPLYRRKKNIHGENTLEGRYGAFPPEERDVIDYTREAIKAKLEDFARYPELRDASSHYSRINAGGQVLTLEEALKMVEIAWPMELQGCRCRRWYEGIEERCKEDYTCMGLTPGSFKNGKWPEMFRGGQVFVTPEDAKQWVLRMNAEGFIHVTGTVGDPPKLYGLCACDYPTCIGPRQLRDYGITRMTPGHYVAVIDPEKCDGCGTCVIRCQFGALTRMAKQKKAYINMYRCMGCGLCRDTCPTGALRMEPRENFPALVEQWPRYNQV